MQSETSITVPLAGRGNLLLWLGVCIVAGLLLAPVFHSLPPRVKFLGIHSWALAACLGAACSWAAQSCEVRSKSLVAGVSVVVTLISLGLLAHWGYDELKRETAQRMPMIPIPTQVGSPEQMAQSLEIQRQLKEAMVPTFTDYQRRRMNSPTLRRIRPLVLWGIELLTSAIVCVFVSTQVQRRVTKPNDSGSLPR
jgi:hypothetical protein